MAVYQDKAKERIKKGLRRMNNIVARGLKEEYKEADTRKIVSDVLSDFLGWDPYENITAEQMISARYADYVVKTEDEDIFVVEVKQIGLKLKQQHLNQARQYAVDEGIDWVILTNGDEWQVYRMEFEGKIPVTDHVFTVRFSDDEMKPAEKTELFYLLSKEANRKKEIEDYYQLHVALSGENLASYILDDAVINKIRIAIKNNTGQRLENSEIAEALLADLFDPAKVNEDHRKTIRKMQRQEQQKDQ